MSKFVINVPGTVVVIDCFYLPLEQDNWAKFDEMPPPLPPPMATNPGHQDYLTPRPTPRKPPPVPKPYAASKSEKHQQATVPEGKLSIKSEHNIFISTLPVPYALIKSVKQQYSGYVAVRCTCSVHCHLGSFISDKFPLVFQTSQPNIQLVSARAVDWRVESFVFSASNIVPTWHRYCDDTSRFTVTLSFPSSNFEFSLLIVIDCLLC